MAPAGRVLLSANRFARAARIGQAALACAAPGECAVFVLSPELPVCWMDVVPGSLSLQCEPLDRPAALGSELECDAVEAAAIDHGRAVFLLDCPVGGPTSPAGPYALCVPRPGAASATRLSVPAFPDGTRVDRLFEGSLVPSPDSVRLFAPVGSTADFRWADAGSCGSELRPGGTIVEWPTMASFNDCYHDEYGVDRAAVASDSDTVVMAALLDRIEEPDPRNRFIVVQSDLAGTMVGTPTHLTVDDLPYVDWNPRLALLDDGTTIVGIRRLMGSTPGPMGDLQDYRALAAVPPLGSAEPVPLRVMTYRADVFDPVALPGGRFALLWADYWAYGSVDWPVCSSSCRPLTIVAGLDGHDLEAPPADVFCLSNGGCVTEARAAFVAGRLVVLWQEDGWWLNLAVLDMSDYVP